jgi:hypothetical protein
MEEGDSREMEREEERYCYISKAVVSPQYYTSEL